jgi:hypothetical protein
MLRLLPHDDDDDDDESRDDLIFEISMEFSRKRLFLLLSRFQKEQRCFTNHTNATIDKALFFFFFFFQNVKRSLLLAKRRKGSGERIHTERTAWSKKASFSSDARKKERKERPKKTKKQKEEIQEDQK